MKFNCPIYTLRRGTPRLCICQEMKFNRPIYQLRRGTPRRHTCQDLLRRGTPRLYTCPIYLLLVTGLVVFFLSNCRKHEALPKQNALPIVSTNAVTDFGATYAVLGGEVISEGSSGVTARGVCWSTHQNPDILTDLTFSKGAGKGVFSDKVTSLNPGETYYIRAYAVNPVGTAYGDQVTITTHGDLPSVSTSNIVLTIDPSVFSCGGTVRSEGGVPVTARGVCWSRSHNPTISDNKTTDGSGMGNFTSTVTGLTSNTAYYLRAYATNSTGTSYGAGLSFALDQASGPTVSDIDGNVYHTVTIGTQVWMVENLRTTHYSNGDPIQNLTNDTGLPKIKNGYSDYRHDINYSKIYGRLYDWYAVTDNRQIAPAGWHVPNEAEYRLLFDWLTNNGYGYQGSGSKIAKAMAARAGWDPGLSFYNPGTSYLSADEVGYDQSTNNRSGFTALAGGRRSLEYGNPRGTDGFHFLEIGYYGWWWIFSAYNSNLGYQSCIGMSYDTNNVGIGLSLPFNGLSVRCIKD